MLRILIKNQILENLYGIKFAITFIVCLILMVGTTVSGLGRFDTQLRDERHIVSTNLGSLAEASEWHEVGEQGVKIVKPANKLGVFSAGLEDSVGRTATVKDSDFPHMEDSIYSTAPIFAVFGQLDLSFIIQSVISLFVILFTYDLVSGEKEKGTLKQCLSNPVPRNTYILGKSIGSFVSLLLPLVIPLLISLLIILVAGGMSYDPDEWTVLGLIFLSYVLYMLAFFSVGLFVSAMTKNSVVSFLVLLFVWVLLVLVIPKGSMMLAGQIHPIPSVNDVRADQFVLRENFQASVWQRTAEEIQRTGAAAIQDRQQRSARFREIRGAIRDEMEPGYKAQNEKLVDDFKREQNNLTTLAINMSRVSPASAVTYIGMNLSGTGYYEQENFIGQLVVFREGFNKFIEDENAKEREQSRGRGFMGPMSAAEDQGQLDVSNIPKFEYQHMNVARRIEMVLPDFAALVIISIIFYLLAFVSFLRYDVR